MTTIKCPCCDSTDMKKVARGLGLQAATNHSREESVRAWVRVECTKCGHMEDIVKGEAPEAYAAAKRLGG